MVLRPGTEPYAHDGGPVGVLLCHGFTGSPASLRPWAEHLASEGHTVRLPLLPGHGTEWRDLQLTRWSDWYTTVDRELRDLAQQCEQVFVMGLSMGGTLTLRLAQQYADAVAGIAVVNPSVHSRRSDLKALPLLRHVVPSVPGISNDIKRPGQDEVAYRRVPLQPLYSLTQLWQDVTENLSSITCPLLVFGSDEDHVVEPSNAVEVVQRVSSTDVTFIPLHDSYHVATLDNDASHIFEQSSAFIRRVVAHGPSDAASFELCGLAPEHGEGIAVTDFPGDAGNADDPLHDPQAVEAAFDEIVAGMDPLTPTAEDGDSGGDRGDGVPHGAAAIPPMLPPRTPRSDWEGWDDVRREPEGDGDGDSEAAVDAAFDAVDIGEEGHYEPPPPPPIPKGDPVTRWAWAGAIGAPVLALVLLLLGQNLDGLLGLFLVGACLGGFVTLLSRLHTGPRLDDGPDDGAVV